MTCFVSLFLCFLLLPCLRKSISRLNHFPFSEVLYVRAKAAESDFKILVPIGSCVVLFKKQIVEDKAIICHCDQLALSTSIL